METLLFILMFILAILIGILIGIPLKHLGRVDQTEDTVEVKEEKENRSLVFTKDSEKSGSYDLHGYLMSQTETYTYCLIHVGGWLVAIVYIDDEDLWVRYIDSNLAKRRVISAELSEHEDFKEKVLCIEVK